MKEESSPCFFSEASSPAEAKSLEGVFHLIQMQRKKKTEEIDWIIKNQGKQNRTLETCLWRGDIRLLKLRPGTVQCASNAAPTSFRSIEGTVGKKINTFHPLKCKLIKICHLKYN